MSLSVVLAVQDVVLSHALEDLLETETGVDVRAVATSAESLLGAVLDHEPDVVLLHEGFGPAPALAVSKELVGRVPWVGIVLLAREVTSDLFTAATDAGVRGVVSVPVSTAELLARLTATAWWSRTVRLGAEAKHDYERAGTVLAVAGAKGGVGTTTLAVQLAFVAAGAPNQRVCLVDLDLFGASLADYLGTVPARSMRELVDLSDELSPAVIHPVLFPHESGARVLFAPKDVMETELLTASLVRRTIAVLRGMFDVVVVDCGSRIYEASLPAVELADRVAMVATPDILAVRAAHDMCDSWEQLDVRQHGSVELVLNRTSKGSAVQPRLVGQTSAIPVCRTGVPAAFRSLEPLANEGATGLRGDRTLARPLQQLARHFGLVPTSGGGFVPLWRWRRAPVADREASATSDGPGRAATRASTDRGSVPVSLPAMVLVMSLGLLLIVQVFTMGAAALVLALSTPTVASEIAGGSTVERAEERLREGGSMFTRSADVALMGDRVAVTLHVPTPFGLPDISLRSDAEVVAEL